MTQLHKVAAIALIAAISMQIASSNNAGATDSIPPDTIASTTTLAATTTTVAPTKLTSRDIVKISKIQTKDPVVFITIDDGVTVSAQLAKVLDKSGVAITTFALPEMVWRARKWYRARENMTFENHTNSHVDMTSINPQKQKIELCHANKLIKEIVGERPIMYRPPRGSWSDENRTSMAKCGLKYAVLWNIVIDDTVPENLKFQKGDIILLHYVSSLPRVLSQILKILKNQKLESALLRDYLQ